jgi:hypothetical protein
VVGVVRKYSNASGRNGKWDELYKPTLCSGWCQ